jgi:hypothetical protein
MILGFVLVVLVLMGLMGVFLITSSRTELNISGNSRLSLETFQTADTAAQISLLMSRIVLHPELGDPGSILHSSAQQPEFSLTVSVNNDRFNLGRLQSDSSDFDFIRRYLEAGLGEALNPQKPHLSFQAGVREVAKAAVTLDTYNIIPQGASLDGGDRYDSSGGPNMQVTAVITVKGQPAARLTGPPENEPSTVITAMFREML